MGRVNGWGCGMKKDLFEKHIEMVKAVNEAKTGAEHELNLLKLNGFREALEFMGINQLMACDSYYIDQGVDVDMCCGVFIDWEPLW
jgi:hypothetical protein